MDTSDYIKRAATRAGYRREFFLEKNMPTHPSNVLAFPFYGDMRSTALLSSLLLKTYRDKHRDKYLILCSWPGMRALFPYVDEYWSIDDESVTKALALDANNLYNGANLATDLTRGLAEVVNVVTGRDFNKYYDNGFTTDYWNTFGKIHRFLPEVPSASLIAPDLKLQLERRSARRVVVYPATKMRSRQQGKTVYLPVHKEFWTALLERLLTEGYIPVVYQNWFTYDMSRDFADRCVYLTPRTAADGLAALRYVGCVLDVHTGISRLATTARCPFVAVTERQSYVEDRDYEIDDLCCDGLPRQYIFGFSTQLIVGGPEDWKTSILDSIVVRLGDFLPTLEKANLPSTNESYTEVQYERVRERKAKRLGVAFINSSKQK